jgi:serine/threonine-protein kinase
MSAPAPIGVIGHYNLLERLEPSGPGELFRARDTRLGRTVTIRRLPPAFTPDAAARAALIEQARGLIALSHPNVTTVFEVAEDDGRIYVVFEYVKGQSLRAEMGGRPMNVRRAVELAIQIADAVADAHGAGYVHGGLSPESVMITAKGHAKIPAFELASRGGFAPEGGEVRLRDYDAPEEAAGQPADDRSDIYSVGAMLYEMLTTRKPMHRGAAAPSASNRHVPRELDEIVLRAVAPNPASRYQSAATFAAELRSMAAVLDVRGGAGDEEDEHDAPRANVGGIVVLTVVVLTLVLTAIWWLNRA